MEDKSELYEKQIGKILQKLVIDVYPVVSNIDLKVKVKFERYETEYDVGMTVYYSKILKDTPRHQRMSKIKDILGLPYSESLWQFYRDIVKYVIPEKIDFGLVNDIDLLP